MKPLVRPLPPDSPKGLGSAGPTGPAGLLRPLLLVRPPGFSVGGDMGAGAMGELRQNPSDRPSGEVMIARLGGLSLCDVVSAFFASDLLPMGAGGATGRWIGLKTPSLKPSIDIAVGGCEAPWGEPGGMPFAVANPSLSARAAYLRNESEPVGGEGAEGAEGSTGSSREDETPLLHRRRNSCEKELGGVCFSSEPMVGASIFKIV